jgi:hypothetical protein
MIRIRRKKETCVKKRRERMRERKVRGKEK